MLTLLAAVTRDVRRLDLVIDNPSEAATIIEAVLGSAPASVSSADMTHASNDYWVVIDEEAVVNRPEYVDFGVIDAALTDVGRVTATVV